ncbi:MAG: hypothetical protein FWD43_04590 [Coriobacteriia bacterium]|nr:hypothetical protein [Coriobacteriia bacterium]
MTYIEEVLGVFVKIDVWDNETKLPYYLLDNYRFNKAEVGDTPCLFMYPIIELPTIPTLKKHLSRIQEVELLPVVLQLDVITAYQRNALLNARIPFVVEGSQLYLPFMALALKERFFAKVKPVRTLTPSAQLLLFHFLYQKHAEMVVSKTAETLGFSAMQISRSVRLLAALRLVQTRYDGRRTVIFREEDRKSLFDRSKPFLLDPVRKRLFAEKDEILPGLHLAGLSALSAMTMLSLPSITTYAVSGTEAVFKSFDVLVDEDTQAEVQVWRYNPRLLSEKATIVDPLSLVASLMYSEDERVEKALDELQAMVWKVREW